MRVWSWAFYQWYFWLIVVMISLFGYTADEILNEPGFITGVFIGYGLVIWILFTIGRLIYAKGRESSEEEYIDIELEEGEDFNNIFNKLYNLFDKEMKGGTKNGKEENRKS